MKWYLSCFQIRRLLLVRLVISVGKFSPELVLLSVSAVLHCNLYVKTKNG
jgi:hypothetical protein